jgi:sRNA-binding regulator protein Hfq
MIDIKCDIRYGIWVQNLGFLDIHPTLVVYMLDKLFTFTQIISKFHYEIYVDKECKSQLIYMHNIDSNPRNQAPGQHQRRP